MTPTWAWRGTGMSEAVVSRLVADEEVIVTMREGAVRARLLGRCPAELGQLTSLRGVVAFSSKRPAEEVGDGAL